MSWTAIAPSPTADAILLIDPCRASPMMKTPGWLDSSGAGGRCSGHTGPGPLLSSRSGPVRIQPVFIASQPPFNPLRSRLAADQDKKRIRRNFRFSLWASSAITSFWSLSLPDGSHHA